MIELPLVRSVFLSHEYTLTYTLCSLFFIAFLFVLATSFKAEVHGDHIKHAMRTSVTMYGHGMILNRDQLNQLFPPITLVQSSADECPICMTVFQKNDTIRRLKCNHCKQAIVHTTLVFHCSCIDIWALDYKAACPLCKRVIWTCQDEIQTNI